MDGLSSYLLIRGSICSASDVGDPMMLCGALNGAVVELVADFILPAVEGVAIS